MSNLEYCFVCNAPTDRAGRADDSICLGSIGPWCEACYHEARDAVLDDASTDTAALEAERDALKAENERLRAALEASRLAITYAIGALQGGLADSDRPYLINVLVCDEQAAREAMGD